jgi:hypothetical protein
MSGKRTSGISATAGIGKASEIHHEIISKAHAITLFALSSNPNGLKKSVKANNNGPLNNAMIDFHLEYVTFSKGTIWVKINHLCILLQPNKSLAERNCHIHSILF